MGNSHSGGRKSRSLPTSPEVRRAKLSSAIPHKGGATSSIPLPGSALPARRCPPDKVRPVAGSSRATSPALSMIPRAPPTSQIASPYQSGQKGAVAQNGSMLDKLKLFKNSEKPSTGTNGKRTSSSSGVSSAKSERSDSSASLDANAESKPVKNISRIKQTTKLTTNPNAKSAFQKNSPNPAKKDGLKTQSSYQNGGTKIATEVEKHANKVAGLPGSKLTEPKVRVSALKETKAIAHQSAGNGTGIPKPTLAVKGTTKPVCPSSSMSSQKGPLSREPSQHSICSPKPAVAMVSPMKAEVPKEPPPSASRENSPLSNQVLKDSQNHVSKDTQLSESSNSASTGPQSNSSDGSVIYKPSSESSCSEHVSNPIPNRKEPLQYLSDAASERNHSVPHPPLEPLREAQETESPIKTKPSPTKERTVDSPRLTTIPNHIRQTISKVEPSQESLDRIENITMKHIREQSSLSQPDSFKANHNGQSVDEDDFNLNHHRLMAFNMDVPDNIKEGAGDNLSIEPMRPLLRGYCSTFTLAGRQRSPYGRGSGEGDYCDISLANGYLSEGELLRGTNPIDISDGYLSEGGSVLYARRLQNMAAQNGCYKGTFGLHSLHNPIKVMGYREAAGGATRETRIPSKSISELQRNGDFIHIRPAVNCAYFNGVKEQRTGKQMEKASH
ncbi:hypothetical protein D910_05073 [Dendroctonus ponderosae]|uniref:Uncharacterized protein n=1 Tax=Dendroctonus ponderosae TaxID=77166 RepID=U4U5R4_DENPD|nr:hypothetical protein D910_05073 [Dendroctonus ponderosae]